MPDVDRNASGTAMMPPTWRLDLIGREILASQILAVMDAHWGRPSAEQKRDILRRAERQIDGQDLSKEIAPISDGAAHQWRQSHP
jgi:hypothetical protein